MISPRSTVRAIGCSARGMLRRAALVLFAAAPALGGVVDVTVTDCCTSACKGTITKLDNPGTCPTPGDCKSGGAGTLDIDVTDAKMELTLKLAGAKILDKTTDACGPMTVNLPIGLGSVAITAIDACPAKAGPITVSIDITNKIAIPGKITSNSVTKDQAGNTLLCLDLTFTPEADRHDDARQKVIDEINGKQSLWRAGHNPRFRGQPVGASKPMLGAHIAENLETIAAMVKSGEMELVDADTRALPSDFDSATAFPKCAKTIGDVRDQSKGRGACLRHPRRRGVRRVGHPEHERRA